MPVTTTSQTTLRRLALAVLAALLAVVALAPQARAADAPEASVPLDDGRGIIGGYYPDAAQWPWMTALLDRTKSGNDYYRHACGGALIAPKLVLTAAHCVVDNNQIAPASKYAVVLGKRRLSVAGGEYHGIARIAIHPSYDSQRLSHDLALLFLDSPSAYAPAPLADPAMQISQGNMSTTMGWGRVTSEGGYYEAHSDDLKAIDMPVWSDGNCMGAGINAVDAKFYAQFEPQTMICAGYSDTRDTTCNGDSGSPMMIPDANRQWRLVGMVSWGGLGCPGGYSPSVYAWTQGPAMYSFIVAGINQSQQSVIPNGQPQGGSRGGPQPSADGVQTTAASLSGVRLDSSKVRRGRALTLRYSSSIAGKVRLRVDRGHRSVGAWVAKARAGSNAVSLRTSRSQPTGRYRVSVWVTGAGGKTNVVTVGYRVVR